MAALAPLLVVLPACLLSGVVLVPARYANRAPGRLSSFVTRVVAMQLLFAVAACVLPLLVPSLPAAINSVDGWWSLSDSASQSVISQLASAVLLDGVALMMLLLVSFVGWVICRYSMRYLDGESAQGNYYRWIGFTIGAVCLMTVSGNLLLFVGAWMLTSLGLHHLLLHYGDRPAAHRAAWTKFSISRIGDFALILAMVLAYSEFQTLEFRQIFATVNAPDWTGSTATMWVAWLIVLGAITKSAQFPFHTWLPQTMETPTPVSALMHAGIVNAGGYLVIRTSPLVSQTPYALTGLAVIGATTACLAAIVMLTQTSIKKSLAYSTIAQMGFMLLQCGLGAYAAAMLHIVAHSLYKAHAFLSSSSVLTRRNAAAGSKRKSQTESMGQLGGIAAVSIAMLVIAFSLFGINPTEKPGGLLLGAVVCLALTVWNARVLRLGSHQLLIRSMAASAALCLVYAASYATVDAIVSNSVPGIVSPVPMIAVGGVIAAGFAGLLILRQVWSDPRTSPRMAAMYVHASNGFYVENVLRRLFGRLASN